MRARLEEARRRPGTFERRGRLEAHAHVSALALVHGTSCICHICGRREETDRLAA
jgi:hypothetical protein